VTTHSVTHWLDQLKAGNTKAAQHLWERYFERLVLFAHARLRNTPRALADEEDVALSAFDTFCRGVAAGRFPKLEDRDDLWKILVVLTARKVSALRDREKALKRSPPEGVVAVDWEEVIGSEPTPDFAAEVAEEYQRLLDRLGDATLRLVAQRKMEGCTNEEIARELSCAPRTVERKLRVIRGILRSSDSSMPMTDAPSDAD
jgi:DNA-directed RNA polymerase specialized sigma24 family protein